MSWEFFVNGDGVIVDKPGGLNSSSAYIGVVPSRNLGLVLLFNRGNQEPHEIGRRLLQVLSRPQAH